MTTMQAKITAEFEARVAAAGWEFVTAAEAANTGVWYVMDGLVTLITVRYSFQAGYAGFTIAGDRAGARAAARTPAAHRRWNHNTGRKGGQYEFHHLEYAKAGELAELLDLVTELLHPTAVQTYPERAGEGANRG